MGLEKSLSLFLCRKAEPQVNTKDAKDICISKSEQVGCGDGWKPGTQSPLLPSLWPRNASACQDAKYIPVGDHHRKMTFF